MRVENTTDRRRSRRRRFEIVDTPGQQRTSRCARPKTNPFVYRPASSCPERAVCPIRTARRRQAPIQGSLLLFKIKTDSLAEPPARARDHAARARRTKADASTSTSSASGQRRRLAPAGAAVAATSRPTGAPRRRRRAPAPTSSTPTATRRVRPSAGAKAANQASVSLRVGSLSPGSRSRSSAVPVLPATVDAGDRGGRAGARAHDGEHQARASCARPRRRVTARVAARRSPAQRASAAARRAAVRRSSPPIGAICSGVASTLPWPIAVEPTARSSPISSRGGIVLARGAGDRRARSLKPKRSAVATSRLARRASRRAARTPSCRTRRRTSRAMPPHASPLAFSSLHARRASPRSATGNVVGALDDCRPRARRPA